MIKCVFNECFNCCYYYLMGNHVPLINVENLNLAIISLSAQTTRWCCFVDISIEAGASSFARN